MNRFWKYQWENAILTKDKYDVSIWIIEIGLIILFSISKTGGFSEQLETLVKKYNVESVAGHGAIYFGIFYFFAFLPFRRHEEMQSNLTKLSEEKNRPEIIRTLRHILTLIVNTAESFEEYKNYDFESSDPEEEARHENGFNRVIYELEHEIEIDVFLPKNIRSDVSTLISKIKLTKSAYNQLLESPDSISPETSNKFYDRYMEKQNEALMLFETIRTKIRDRINQ
jgi:uncharacterized protein (UPF0147 family)